MSDLMGSPGRRSPQGRRGARPPEGTGDVREESPASSDLDLHQGTVDSDRLRRRARFLRELSEAQALRERVQPRRARVARMRQQMRMRTFRW